MIPVQGTTCPDYHEEDYKSRFEAYKIASLLRQYSTIDQQSVYWLCPYEMT